MPFLLFILVGFVNAQTSIIQNAKTVNQLVSLHGDKLDEKQQIILNKHLERVIEIFKQSGYSAPSLVPYSCENSENKLINLENGIVIHDFFSKENCNEALINLKVGKGFCDYTDNTLFLNNGNQVFDLFSDVNCKDAVESIYRSNRFCDYSDNTLRKADGTLLYDFSSKEECTKALE